LKLLFDAALATKLFKVPVAGCSTQTFGSREEGALELVNAGT
jgi:hypothetical protein